MMVFSAIVTVAKTGKKIQEFVEGELVTILSAIGDNEYKAARGALENLGLAKDKKSQVSRVVGHLESAHTAYWDVYGISKGWKDYFTLVTRITALQKDIFTLSLMAICYRYLDETAMMQEVLRKAGEAMKQWTELDQGYVLGELSDARKRKNVVSAVGSWFNAKSWPFMVEASLHGFPSVKEEEFVELCRYLKYKPQLNA